MHGTRRPPRMVWLRVRCKSQMPCGALPMAGNHRHWLVLPLTNDNVAAAQFRPPSIRLAGAIHSMKYSFKFVKASKE